MITKIPLLTLIQCNGVMVRTALEIPPTLEHLQKLVGGFIQLVPNFDYFLSDDCVAFCNDNGKLLKLPVNEYASEHWYKCFPEVRHFDKLVGDVAIISGDPSFLELL